MKKRIISILLLLMFVLSLCGCSTISEIAGDAINQAVNDALQSSDVSSLLNEKTIQEMLNSSGIQALLENGVSVLDMLKNGISLDSLVQNGLTSDILSQSGITLHDLQQLNIDENTLSQYGLNLFGSTQESEDASDAGNEASVPTENENPSAPEETVKPAVDENGQYTSKDDVALYIHTYGHLPSNFITKSEAKKLGWEGGSLEKYASGKSIGGDRFGNYEGLLPEMEGRSYTECDIDTMGANSRGAKRIVFSNDGLIYYTDDHYESFTLLYGNEG